MDGIKNAVFTDKSIRLLGKNQYTSNVESGSTRTELKHWVELFFGVKVIAMNSHRLPGKGRRMGPIMGHTMHYRRMIITLQPDSQVKSNPRNNLIYGQHVKVVMPEESLPQGIEGEVISVYTVK
ncbi:60S ribosomal protein L23A [Castilleja foliolosa]|uniref:Large ribosomal subunit protein uL23cz/uL23cy n=1 Tax=Castilleja foliolosa TaxID=1961234 RepID=A0ABD3B6M0_9LAMI